MWQNILEYFQKDMDTYLQAIGQHLTNVDVSIIEAATGMGNSRC